MASYRNHLLISFVLLSLLFAFVYFFTDARGSTQVGVTIQTNPNLEDGLVGHWTFDGEIQTQITDSSVNANHGFEEHLVGAEATTSAPGVMGQGWETFGRFLEHSYINIGSPASLDDIEDQGGGGMTLSIWAKPTGLAEFSDVLLSKNNWPGDSTGSWFLTRNSAGTITFQKSYSTTNLEVRSADSVKIVPTNQWSHVLVIWDGSAESDNALIYIDGEEVGSYDARTDGVGSKDSDAANILGIGGGECCTTFDGVLDDARIYNRILSQQEITRLYELGATTKIGKTITTNSSLDDGLVAHWSFDGVGIDRSNNTGEILDVSGNFAGLGNWQDHATTTVPGKIGQAIEFDGVDDAIEWSNGPFNRMEENGFSTFAWINVKGSTGAGQTIFDRDIYGPRMDTTSSGDRVRCFSQSDEPAPYSTSYVDINYNEWYHVGCVFSTTTKALTLYLNGASSTSADITGFGQFFGTDSADLHIGEGYNDANYFNGLIDDVRFYNRNLSLEEVQRLYQLGATTKVGKTITTNFDLEDGLLGHWTFDGSLQNEIPDVSSYNHLAYFATTTPTSTAVTPGNTGQGIVFDGVDDIVILANGSGLLTDTLSSFTYALWMYPTSWGKDDEGELINNSLDSILVFKQIRLHNSGAPLASIRAFVNCVGACTNASVYTAANSVRLNEWQHVAMTYDDSPGERMIRIYLNGEEADYDSNVSGTGTTQGDAASKLLLGDTANHPLNDENFEGKMDGVRVYNRPLSAQEVKRLYQLGQ